MLTAKLIHGANALVCLSATVAAGSAIAAAGPALSGLLSWNALQSDAIAPDLAKELATEMETRLSHPGVTQVQRVLIPQMIEIASRPDPKDVINAGLDPEHLITLMEKPLTDPEHRRPENLALFREIVTPALKRMLDDPEFTEKMAPAFMRTVLERLHGLEETTRATLIAALETRADVGRIEEKIDLLPGQFAALLGGDLARAPRDILEALASRFRIADAWELSDAELRHALEKKAEDWRKLKAEVEALRARFPQLDNHITQARARLDEGDTAGVRQMVRDARKVLRDTRLREALEQDAELVEIDVDALLFEGQVDEAHKALAAAADSFASIDPLEPARRRILQYSKNLRNHGLRYGGSGIARALDLLAPVLSDDLRQADAWLWAAGINAQAICYTELGSRTGGQEGAALLGEAVDAYRTALQVTTRADHSVDWAGTQNNLGTALLKQGSRTGGPEGASLLGQAVDAYRAALEVYTRADHAVDWAMTQNNLGATLGAQGSRTGGPDGAALLGQAVDAYRTALEVYTRADHPVHWAGTQNNLGNALQAQGSRTGGPEGAVLLGEAVDAFRAALEVSTRADHPVGWAMTQESLARAEIALALHDTCPDWALHLRAALAHVEAALEVYDPRHMSHDHQKATTLRDDIRKALDGDT